MLSKIRLVCRLKQHTPKEKTTEYIFPIDESESYMLEVLILKYDCDKLTCSTAS